MAVKLRSTEKKTNNNPPDGTINTRLCRRQNGRVRSRINRCRCCDFTVFVWLRYACFADKTQRPRRSGGSACVLLAIADLSGVCDRGDDDVAARSAAASAFGVSSSFLSRSVAPGEEEHAKKTAETRPRNRVKEAVVGVRRRNGKREVLRPVKNAQELQRRCTGWFLIGFSAEIRLFSHKMVESMNFSLSRLNRIAVLTESGVES